MSTPKTTYSKDAKAILSEFHDYAYRVSHDLNAPVRTMVEFSKMLSQEHSGNLNADAKQYLWLIIESGQKMQAMMEGLLEYSRLSTHTKEMTPINIGVIIQNLLLILEDPIKKSGAKFIVGELPTLNADSEQIMLLFKALIDNAIKFQPKDNIPLITISAEKKSGFWQFAISDNGIGMKQQFQDKIFKLFGRLHPDNQYQGVGVGLTLAQKVVHLNGGKIWFESTIGNGCIFYFTLPLE